MYALDCNCAGVGFPCPCANSLTRCLCPALPCRPVGMLSFSWSACAAATCSFCTVCCVLFFFAFGSTFFCTVPLQEHVYKDNSTYTHRGNGVKRNNKIASERMCFWSSNGTRHWKWRMSLSMQPEQAHTHTKQNKWMECSMCCVCVRWRAVLGAHLNGGVQRSP